LDGGANVVAVLERRNGPAWRTGGRWQVPRWPTPFLLVDGVSLATRLANKLHWNRKVTRLVGNDRVRGVEAGDLVLEADIVALNYGFASSSNWPGRWAAPIASCRVAAARWKTLTDGRGAPACESSPS